MAVHSAQWLSMILSLQDFPARLPTQNAPSGEALICELLQHHPQDLHAMAPVRKANE
jgi:hypothetical protein